MKLLAKTFQGLEDVLAEEIKRIGGKNVQPVTRAVLYEGDKEVLYKSNLLLRTALRILIQEKEFVVKDTDHLYKIITKMPWENRMTLEDTFAIDCITSGEVFTHSQYAGLRVKDGIVDRFNRKFDRRPNVNIMTPTYRYNVHIRDTKATFSLDSTGDSLHKRGYRVTTVDAPLNEVMAAGIILLSGWDGNTDFLDPMCGGATYSCEAAMIAYGIPPQRKDREFGFMKWKDFDKELWNRIIEDAYPEDISPKIKIIASDKNMRAWKVSQQNIDHAGLSELISVERKDFFKKPHAGNYTIFLNPPYDERLKVNDINKFYSQIGDTLKTFYPDSEAWVFSGNIEAIKSVGLKTSKKYTLKNAALDSRLFKFDLYSGTKEK